MMRRSSAGQKALPAAVTVLVCVCAAANWSGSTSAGSEMDQLKGARSAFKQKQYERTVDLLDALGKESGLPPEGMRLKIRALLRLGKPKEALHVYDQLEPILKRDDDALLKEVAVGFVVILSKDMREQMRGASYTALKDMESPEAVPFLEDGLSDGSGLVRALAAEGLGKTDQGRRSLRLRKALDDQAGLVKAAVLKVLGRSRDRDVLPLLEKALSEEQPLVRLAASGALYHMGKKEMWEQVRKGTSVVHPEERATALRLLGELKDSRGLPVLLDALRDPQPSVRGAAASALGDLGDPQAIPRLEEALQDTIPAVRTSAAISLGELGDKKVAPVLRRALSDANPVVQAAVVSVLLRLDEPFQSIAAPVGRLLQHNDPGTRSALAKALGRARGDNKSGALDVLSELFGDPIPRPRIAAARSLGQIGGRDLIPALKRGLHDEDDAVRATAGASLTRILDATTRPSHI